MNRRLFLASTGCIAAQTTWGLATGLLLIPNRATAGWPADLFFAEKLDDALRVATGNAPLKTSGKVEILADSIAENGATVPVAVHSHLPGTRSITLFSDSNPAPTLARFRMSPGLEPYIGVRIKMGGTGHVIAVVETDRGVFSARKGIKVTAGGCA